MQYLLAHQGGWDEILMFLIPIGLVVGTWYMLDKRKARREGSADDPKPRQDSSSGP